MKTVQVCIKVAAIHAQLCKNDIEFAVTRIVQFWTICNSVSYYFGPKWVKKKTFLPQIVFQDYSISLHNLGITTSYIFLF